MAPRRSLARRARPVVGFAVILAVDTKGANDQKQTVTLTEGGK